MRRWRQSRGQFGKDNINLSPEGLCRVSRLLSRYMHKKRKQLEQPLGCSSRDGRAGVGSAAGHPESPTQLPQENQSPVLERREHRNGVLQLEGCANSRKKDGG